MARIQLWQNGRKGLDYTFLDRSISNFMGASGAPLYVHKYLGVHDQTAPVDGDSPAPPSITDIQDVLLMENRDRQYSPDVFELRGCYTIQESSGFDMKQFGLFISDGATFVETHLNDMLALLGRKIMPGDVIELPHERDDALLNGGKAINKFYVVAEADRAADGWSPTWFPHIWRIKLNPMTASQEFADILDMDNTDPFGLDTGDRLGDLISIAGADMDLNQAIVDQAIISVKARNFETRQYYVTPGEELTGADPWIFTGDGVPPNGAIPLGSGRSFPTPVSDGDYYLRTDYQPHTLFRFSGNVWRQQEVDYRRGSWSMAHRLLEDFVNNTDTTTFLDGTTALEKTSLSKAVKPKADF
jgi:hypothetical protein